MPPPQSPPPRTSGASPPPQRTTGKNIRMLVLGIVSTLYLANPSLGIFELIPDNLPGVGNIDEALATVLLLRVMAYFGIYVGGLGKKNKEEEGPVIDIDPPGKK